MISNNSKINDIIDSLNFGVENFELPKIESSLEKIAKYHINYDPEILEKAYEIVDESKINPKYCEEK